MAVDCIHREIHYVNLNVFQQVGGGVGRDGGWSAALVNA